MPNPEGLSATIWPQEPSAFRSMHGGALRGLARLRITSHAFMAAEKHSQTVEDYHYFAQRTILAWKRQRAEEEQALARKRQRRDEEISHEPSWCVSQILRQLKEAIGWTIGPIAMRLAEVKSHSSLLRDAPVTASFQDFNWNWSLQFEDRLRLRAAYNPVLAEDTVLTSSQSYKLTAHDLRTLENLTWLNDEVVNIYFSLIQRRSEERPGFPRTFVFNSFFYEKLSNKGGGFNYPSVSRWTRKVDLFSYDLILVPVHLSVHWTLAVIALHEQRIEFYDSLGSVDTTHAQKLLWYLEEEWRDKRQKQAQPEWHLHLPGKSAPQQRNHCDCGVFMCQFANFRARGMNLQALDQQHMEYFRGRMTLELLQLRLLG
eukprot:TRINITY_DN3472_c0_g1_i8.p1 TRINITY_DN3472_c0_g1~~TRINITY_DN3472_c0_g1_i8.p1  ORF type:complete len:372 (+),score=74.19 TRINITY_DN3472_c0_g1_i8:48-1163(+)